MTDMANTNESKPGPRTRRVPKTFASEGAVRQNGGTLPVYVCNTCGHEVVWCESKRTGRPYLVSVTRGYHDQRFYMGHNVHPRDCGERRQAAIDQHAAYEAEQARQAAAAAWVPVYMQARKHIAPALAGAR